MPAGATAAWQAATDHDWPAFDAIAERAAAWRGTSEMALESRQQGGSFLAMTRVAWPHPALEETHQRLAGEISLPVAVALAAAAHDIALARALEGYLHAFVANLIEADLLAILTNTGGLHTADPHLDPTATLIERVDRIDAEVEALAGGSISDRAIGGMATKLQAARLATASGVDVVIASAHEPRVLPRLAAGEVMNRIRP